MVDIKSTYLPVFDDVLLVNTLLLTLSAIAFGPNNQN